jgi:signal transduction histidine kinase
MEATAQETRRIEPIPRRQTELGAASRTSFGDLSLLAARACDAPYALLSLNLSGTNYAFSKTGWSVHHPDPFAGYVMRQGSQVFVIADTLADDRFSGEFDVREGPRIRFYAGVALRDWNGYAVGNLSVMDIHARPLTPLQEETLHALSRQASAQVELCLGLERLTKQMDELKVAQAHLLASDRLTLLGRLSACVAHEVNNPLACVISNLSFVMRELANGESNCSNEVRQAMAEASEGAERIRQTVLALRRLELGGLDLGSGLPLKPEEAFRNGQTVLNKRR